MRLVPRSVLAPLSDERYDTKAEESGVNVRDSAQNKTTPLRSYRATERENKHIPVRNLSAGVRRQQRRHKPKTATASMRAVQACGQACGQAFPLSGRVPVRSGAADCEVVGRCGGRPARQVRAAAGRPHRTRFRQVGPARFRYLPE